MRTLKYVILGLLMRHPMSGYDITKEFQNGLTEFWDAKHSQIYPELRRLYDEGLITYEVQISGEALEKKVYSITEQGRQEFHAWVEEDVDTIPFQRDVFRLKLYFSDNLEPAAALHIIDAQRCLHRQKLEHLEDKVQRCFGTPPQRGTPTFGDYVVITGAIMRERAYHEWLDACTALYQSEP